jgi:hypothetical protein
MVLTVKPHLVFTNSRYWWEGVMDARQQRGLEIAATANLVRKGGAWMVPSQSGKGHYTVCLDA